MTFMLGQPGYACILHALCARLTMDVCYHGKHKIMLLNVHK